MGLTGGIASGKVMISKYLASLGAKIIDADKLPGTVKPGRGAWENKGLFGAAVSNEDQTE